MKIVFSALIVSVLGFSVAYGQSSDEEAIKQLLQNETEAFTKMSLADVAKKFWVLDDRTLLNVTMPDGNHLQLLKDDLLSQAEVPPEGHAKVAKSDFRFLINGNTALVSFSQTVTTVEGDAVNSHEIRYMDKVNGEWKIHVSSVHQFVPKGRE